MSSLSSHPPTHHTHLSKQESSYLDHEMEQCNTLVRSTLIGVAMTSFMHWKMGTSPSTHPPTHLHPPAAHSNRLLLLYPPTHNRGQARPPPSIHHGPNEPGGPRPGQEIPAGEQGAGLGGDAGGRGGTWVGWVGGWVMSWAGSISHPPTYLYLGRRQRHRAPPPPRPTRQARGG